MTTITLQKTIDLKKNDFKDIYELIAYINDNMLYSKIEKAEKTESVGPFTQKEANDYLDSLFSNAK